MTVALTIISEINIDFMDLLKMVCIIVILVVVICLIDLTVLAQKCYTTRVITMTQQNSQQPDICGAICALATFTLIPNPPVSDTETVVLLSNSLEIERKCQRVYLVY